VPSEENFLFVNNDRTKPHESVIFMHVAVNRSLDQSRSAHVIVRFDMQQILIFVNDSEQQTIKQRKFIRVVKANDRFGERKKVRRNFENFFIKFFKQIIFKQAAAPVANPQNFVGRNFLLQTFPRRVAPIRKIIFD
jgi:hypothetical protein